MLLIVLLALEVQDEKLEIENSRADSESLAGWHIFKLNRCSSGGASSPLALQVALAVTVAVAATGSCTGSHCQFQCTQAGTGRFTASGTGNGDGPLDHSQSTGTQTSTGSASRNRLRMMTRHDSDCRWQRQPASVSANLNESESECFATQLALAVPLAVRRFGLRSCLPARPQAGGAIRVIGTANGSATSGAGGSLAQPGSDST